jgi:hypothetical protein
LVLALFGEPLPFFALARRSVRVGTAGFLGVAGIELSGLELGCIAERELDFGVWGLGGNIALA